MGYNIVERLSIMISWRDWIERTDDTCDAQLRAKGTRVLVSNILDSLAEGATSEQIIGSFPTLKPEHIAAAMAYAAELAREESLLPTTHA